MPNALRTHSIWKVVIVETDCDQMSTQKDCGNNLFTQMTFHVNIFRVGLEVEDVEEEKKAQNDRSVIPLGRNVCITLIEIR